MNYKINIFIKLHFNTLETNESSLPKGTRNIVGASIIVQIRVTHEGGF